MSHDVSLYELVTKATQADIDVIDNEITLLVCERDAKGYVLTQAGREYLRQQQL